MRHRGFTLVEMIAVVLVLAVLGGVAVGKFYDQRQRALRSSEDATARTVRAGVSQYITSHALTGSAAPPATLDGVAAGATSSNAAPFFVTVMANGVTSEWKKGAAVNTYIGPAGTTYFYDPATGAFTSDAAAIAAAAAANAKKPVTSLVNAATWTAGSAGSPTLSAGVHVGTGYMLSGDSIELTDPTSAFTEAGRRTVITGQAIAEGSYTLNLETRLTDYWTQLNYWQVYYVKNGTTLNLSGNNLNWGSAPAGTKLAVKDYAPANMSNGQYFGYANNFTVSAADAVNYDQIVIMMAGTKSGSQILSWQNVSLTKN